MDFCEAMNTDSIVLEGHFVPDYTPDYILIANFYKDILLIVF